MLVPAVHTTSNEVVVRGEIDVSAAAAVSAVRGTGVSATHPAAGTYTVTVTQVNKTLTNLISEAAGFARSVPATALGVRINSVVQNADLSLTISIKTMANATTGADTDTTAATTIWFQVVFQGTNPGDIAP